MSDSILKIISINADYVPAKAQQIQAKEFVSKIFKTFTAMYAVQKFLQTNGKTRWMKHLKANFLI